jgi:hypothetical protein
MGPLFEFSPMGPLDYLQGQPEILLTSTTMGPIAPIPADGIESEGFPHRSITALMRH